MTLIDTVVIDPAIAMGKPTIKGTRIGVDFVLERIAIGDSIDSIIKEHPKLSKEKVSNAIRWAAANLYYPRQIYAPTA